MIRAERGAGNWNTPLRDAVCRPSTATFLAMAFGQSDERKSQGLPPERHVLRDARGLPVGLKRASQKFAGARKEEAVVVKNLRRAWVNAQFEEATSVVGLEFDAAVASRSSRNWSSAWRRRDSTVSLGASRATANSGPLRSAK